jgi:ATP-dependent DNA helicase RecQ
MLEYEATTACRMRFLREQLDDTDAQDCGRCDNCRRVGIAVDLDASAVADATEQLAKPGVAVDARRMWPSAMAVLGVPVSGKIAADEQAEEGRAIARFTDLGHGPRVRQLLRADTPDGPVPDDLVRAAVAVLASWGWEERPTAIVSVGSHRRPQLVRSLADALSTVGRLPYLGELSHRGGSRPDGQHNSAQRLAAVWDSYEDAAVAEALAGHCRGRALLVVDDTTDTGWTLTVVARLLRRAGAGRVYPLVLGVAQ